MLTHEDIPCIKLIIEKFCRHICAYLKAPSNLEFFSHAYAIGTHSHRRSPGFTFHALSLSSNFKRYNDARVLLAEFVTVVHAFMSMLLLMSVCLCPRLCQYVCICMDVYVFACDLTKYVVLMYVFTLRRFEHLRSVDYWVAK